MLTLTTQVFIEIPEHQPSAKRKCTRRMNYNKFVTINYQHKSAKGHLVFFSRSISCCVNASSSRFSLAMYFLSSSFASSTSLALLCGGIHSKVKYFLEKMIWLVLYSFANNFKTVLRFEPWPIRSGLKLVIREPTPGCNGSCPGSNPITVVKDFLELLKKFNKMTNL